MKISNAHPREREREKENSSPMNAMINISKCKHTHTPIKNDDKLKFETRR